MTRCPSGLPTAAGEHLGRKSGPPVSRAEGRVPRRAGLAHELESSPSAERELVEPLTRVFEASGVEDIVALLAEGVQLAMATGPVRVAGPRAGSQVPGGGDRHA